MNEDSGSDPVRKQVLQKAMAATLGDRNKAYGDPSVNMGLAARLKDMYRAAAGGRYSKAHDDSIEMVLSKIARIATGAIGHTDNYVDGAAYMAIACECQASNEVLAQAKDRDIFDFIDRLTPPVVEQPIKPLPFPTAAESNMLNPYAPKNKK